jgi:hypothetical protein
MNWRRGLLRLWLVLSLCWIAGVGLYAWARSIGAQLVRLWRAASGYGGCPASVWKNPSEIESRQINKTGHF